MNEQYLESVRYLDPPVEIRTIISDAVAGKISIDEAVEIMLFEYARGQRFLVLDENLLDLEPELLDLNYVVSSVRAGLSDDQIKQQLTSRIFITKNGKDFVSDMEKYHYGLVWVVTSIDDPKYLAKAIERKLMASGFKRNLVQAVKV